jgi:hypothetical protein
MTTMFIPDTFPTIKNKGIRAQANMTVACGLTYAAHDGKSYDSASDIEYMGHHISVKAYHFTLMSGTMCEGKTTVNDIWDVYARTTHSDRFAYVLGEMAYVMDIIEFEKFVKLFCEIEKASPNEDRQHTGSVKVRAKRCERNMKKWFEMQIAY